MNTPIDTSSDDGDPRQLDLFASVDGREDHGTDKAELAQPKVQPMLRLVIGTRRSSGCENSPSDVPHDDLRAIREYLINKVRLFK